jgi:hypothetical protein
MIYCDVCKIKEAKNLTTGGNWCDSCLFDLCNSVKWYVNGQEVTKEEYDRFIKGEN